MPSGAVTRLPPSRKRQWHGYTSGQQRTSLPALTLSMQSMALASQPLSPLPAEAQPTFPYPTRQRRPRSAGKQLPPQTSTTTQLNGILGVDGALSIDYDIRRPTASAVCLPRGGLPHTTGDWRYQTVTAPGLESMTIRVAFMRDVPIVVFPSGPAQAVCIEDVLRRVHEVAADHMNGWRREGGLELLGRAQESSSTSHKPLSMLRSGSENGWRWRGLVASRAERDVWILLLE
jgi:hypothetical protein